MRPWARSWHRVETWFRTKRTAWSWRIQISSSRTWTMGQVASTRECRLLAATASAYGIDVTGGFTQLPPYFDAVGFVDSPTAIVGGIDGVNACLVGTNRDDGVVVAFRGTLPPE